MWPPKSLGNLVISWKLVSDFLQGLQLVNLAEGLCVCMCACVCVCVYACVYVCGLRYIFSLSQGVFIT